MTENQKYSGWVCSICGFGFVIIVAITAVLGRPKDNQVISMGNVFNTTVATPSYSFDDLLDAIEWVESRGAANAVCPDGCCVGAYQLTEIYVDDANRIMRLFSDEWAPWVAEDSEIRKAVPAHMDGQDIYFFNYEDRWDREKSRMITNIVTCYYAGRDWSNKRWDMNGWLETAARTHKNPTERNSESTKEYWLKVKARLEKNAGTGTD